MSEMPGQCAVLPMVALGIVFLLVIYPTSREALLSGPFGNGTTSRTISESHQGELTARRVHRCQSKLISLELNLRR